jgi:hypothetical protein
MPVALYMDVHVPTAVTTQLQRRGVDVLTAWEDGTTELDDAALLLRAKNLGRVLFTQDLRFKALAERWQREQRSFAGLIFGHQLGGTIGQYVHDLELIAKASDPSDWTNLVEHIPYPANRVTHE